MSSVDVYDLNATEARAITDRIKVGLAGTWELVKTAYTNRAWVSLGYDSWDDYCTAEFGNSRLRLPHDERGEVMASMRELGMSQRAISSGTGCSRNVVRKELRAPRRLHMVLKNHLDDDHLNDDVPSVEALADMFDVTPEQIEQAQQFTEEHPELVEKAIAGKIDLSKTLAPPPPPVPEPRVEPERVTGTDGKSYAAKTVGKRKPLPPQFRTVGADLTKLINRIERLWQDDRYRTNKATIAELCVPEYRRATEVLSNFLDDLNKDA